MKPILALVMVVVLIAAGATALASASDQTTHDRADQFDAVFSAVLEPFAGFVPWLFVIGALVAAIAVLGGGWS